MSTYTYLLFEDLIDKKTALGKAFYYKIALKDDEEALRYGLYLGDCLNEGITPETDGIEEVYDANSTELAGTFNDGTPILYKNYDYNKFAIEDLERTVGINNKDGDRDYASDLEEQSYVGIIMKEGSDRPLFVNSFFVSSPKKGLFRKRESSENRVEVAKEELNGLMDYYKDLLARPKRKYISWLDEFVNFETDLSDDDQIEAVNYHEDNFYSFLGDEIDAVIDARPLPINIKAICRKAYEICALDYLYNVISGNEKLPEKYNNGEEEDWMEWMLNILEGYDEAGDKACEHISATIRDFYSDIPEVVRALDIMFH